MDLAAIARGAGLKRVHTVAADGDVAEGAKMLRADGDTCFVLASVKPTDGPKGKLNLFGDECRTIFRRALLGPA